jgi:hypothetical protein
MLLEIVRLGAAFGFAAFFIAFFYWMFDGLGTF